MNRLNVSKKLECLRTIFNWKYACMLVLCVTGVMSFLLALGKTYHYDEAYSVGMIYNSFQDIIDITSQDVHSPFYYFVLKIFCMIPGVEILTGAKICSWIFFVMYMFLGGWIAYKHYDGRVAFYWLLLSGFMPSMIIQSTTVRMYTIGLFFMTLASYLAYSTYCQESRKKWIIFTISAAITVYIHTFCMLEMVLYLSCFPDSSYC